jgi:hypothetical protein
VNYSLGNKNEITRHKIVRAIVDKEMAPSAREIIYLKPIVVMMGVHRLTHAPLAVATEYRAVGKCDLSHIFSPFLPDYIYISTNNQKNQEI